MFWASSPHLRLRSPRPSPLCREHLNPRLPVGSRQTSRAPPFPAVYTLGLFLPNIVRLLTEMHVTHQDRKAGVFGAGQQPRGPRQRTCVGPRLL